MTPPLRSTATIIIPKMSPSSSSSSGSIKRKSSLEVEFKFSYGCDCAHCETVKECLRNVEHAKAICPCGECDVRREQKRIRSSSQKGSNERGESSGNQDRRGKFFIDFQSILF